MRHPPRTVALLLALLSHPAASRAESAADKATARQVATEGIELFRAGKFEPALDRLRRAQALFDAPVHLLYIARSLAGLGHLVESAETYRSLDRYELPEGAPEAWVLAVGDGRKELALLEPRIPRLHLRTEPADLPAARVGIDGADVSAAVLGIARPIDPGPHHVEVAAEGYEPARVDLVLAEGEVKEVVLTPVKAKVATSATPDPGAARGHTQIGFMAGLRLGAGIPTGTLLNSRVLGREVKVTDGFQPGGGFELHTGVRLGRHFTPLLYIEAEQLSPGNGLVPGGKDPKKTTAGAFGIGLMVATPPGKMGGFGEVDLVLAQTYSLSQVTPTGETCNLAARGGGLRFGGGGNFPVARWLHLTPFAMATLGRFTSLNASAGCGAVAPSGDVPASDVRTHGMVFLGVGGDVVLGKDRD